MTFSPAINEATFIPGLDLTLIFLWTSCLSADNIKTIPCFQNSFNFKPPSRDSAVLRFALFPRARCLSRL
ncbi:hypothetical protein T09_5989 [Trichinella sp. T9]|nr:hypothetical protein T09_5989 [Trichinella sp. T9]